MMWRPVIVGVLMEIQYRPKLLATNASETSKIFTKKAWPNREPKKVQKRR